ncbi:MAG: hypothetical protein E6X72_11865 [Clostridioides difficile]|nr:hypothetical protein [Clostridioides difficile]
MENIEAEKLRSQFGLFAYENESFVDSSQTSEKHIEAHEYIHMMLSKSTSYGMFIVMLKKALVMDKSKEWIKDIFSSNMKKMQECAATSIQYLYILRESGYDEYLREYKQLKLNNREYFNYLKNVSWLMETATEENVESYISIIQSIGRMSLQIDVNSIPKEVFISEKEMKRFNNDINNSLLYNPSIRFKNLIKFYQYVLQGNKENSIKYTDSVSIISKATLSYSDNNLDNVRKAIEKVFANSAMLKKIMKRTSTYKNIKVSCDFKNGEYNLCIYPTSLNERSKVDYDMESVYISEFIEIINKQSDGYLHIVNRVTGIEKFHVFSYTNPITKKIILTECYTIDDIANLLNVSNIPIIFDEKKRFIDYKDILDINKKMYVFMESAIFYNSTFIRDYFNNSTYTIISYGGYNCICIKKGQYTMLQLISPNGIEPLKKFIEKEELNINYIELGVSGLYRDKDEIGSIIQQHVSLINYSLRCRKDL